MESLVNTTRSRGPGCSVQVLVLVLSILGGFTIGLGVIREAEGRVKTLEWVEEVENNIEQVPLSAGDRPIRGKVTLVGLVESELLKGVAEVRTQSVPLVRSVDNQLVVRETSSLSTV